MLVMGEPCKFLSRAAAGWHSSRSPLVSPSWRSCLHAGREALQMGRQWVQPHAVPVEESFLLPIPAVGISQFGSPERPAGLWKNNSLPPAPPWRGWRWWEGCLSQEQRDSGAAGGQLGALPASQFPVGGLRRHRDGTHCSPGTVMPACMGCDVGLGWGHSILAVLSSCRRAPLGQV